MTSTYQTVKTQIQELNYEEQRLIFIDLFKVLFEENLDNSSQTSTANQFLYQDMIVNPKRQKLLQAQKKFQQTFQISNATDDFLDFKEEERKNEQKRIKNT